MSNEPHARAISLDTGRWAAEFKPSWRTTYQKVKGEIKGRYGVLTWRDAKDAEIAAWRALNEFEHATIRSYRGLTGKEWAEEEFSKVFGARA